MKNNPLKNIMRLVLLGCASLSLSACMSFKNDVPQATEYDLGAMSVQMAAAPTVANKSEVIVIPNVLTSGAVDGREMVYRYSNVLLNEPKKYVHSNWVQHPAEMLRSRAQQYLGARFPVVLTTELETRTSWSLRLTLEDFSQHFSSESQSEGVVQVRATLVRAGQLIDQKVFCVATKANTPDAKGEAQALTRSTDETLKQIGLWLFPIIERQ